MKANIALFVFWSDNNIFVFFCAFSDSLFAQNQSYKLFMCLFALLYKETISLCDK